MSKYHLSTDLCQPSISHYWPAFGHIQFYSHLSLKGITSQLSAIINYTQGFQKTPWKSSKWREKTQTEKVSNQWSDFSENFMTFSALRYEEALEVWKFISSKTNIPLPPPPPASPSNKDPFYPWRLRNYSRNKCLLNTYSSFKVTKATFPFCFRQGKSYY